MRARPQCEVKDTCPVAAVPVAAVPNWIGLDWIGGCRAGGCRAMLSCPVAEVKLKYTCPVALLKDPGVLFKDPGVL